MNLSTFEIKFAYYIEKNIILNFFDGVEKFGILFILPFKLKEFKSKLFGNKEILSETGFLCNDELDIAKLKAHTLEVANKCGPITISILSKNIKITPEDIQTFFNVIESQG